MRSRLRHSFPANLVWLFAMSLAYQVFGQRSFSDFVPVEPQHLSHTFVKCFYKDSYGFMWIGTADGLVRYDGTNVVQYDHSPGKANSIPHNTVNAILEDSSRNIWVGTSQGLSVYQREADQFLSIDSIPGIQNTINNRYVTSLALDRQGKLWVGTHGNGINVFDLEAKRFHFLDVEMFPTQAPSQYINHMTLINDEVWCATKGGLKVYNSVTLEPLDLLSIGEDLAREQITQVLKGKEGDVLIGTLSGRVFSLLPRNGYYYQRELIGSDKDGNYPLGNALAMVQRESGEIWVGGEFSGLSVLNAKSQQVTSFLPGGDLSFPSNSVRSIYMDDEGYLWIGTFNKGAYILRSNIPNFDSYDRVGFSESVLKGKNVRSFAEDHQGKVWMAYDEIGLIAYDPAKRAIEPSEFPYQKVGSRYLTALEFDRAGDLWVGTESRGIFRYQPSTGSLKRYDLKSGGFGDNNVFSIYVDRQGKVWAGTIGSGLFYYDEIADQFELLCEEDRPDFINRTSYVSSFAEDMDGTFWVGTMFGLYALNAATDGGYTYRLYHQGSGEGAGLSSSTVQTLFMDENYNLWIGTADNGLNVKRRGSEIFEVFQQNDGLMSNAIRSIITDLSGNLWLSTSRGLSKFNPIDSTFSNYSEVDGLSSNNFFHNAVIRAQDGKLFFGNNNGFNAFYPDSIKPLEKQPVIYLTDLKINNQSVKVGEGNSPLRKHIGLTSELELSYDQRSFVLEYVAVGYGNPNRHNYCYMLQGFDRDWNCGVNAMQATYTNIDPGTYTFLVRASNSDGVWTEEPVSVQIRVLPRIWETWWAKLGYLMLAGALLTFAYRFRMERLKMRNQLHLERIEREREHELSESKTQFFTNVSHELRTPLSLILMPLEAVQQSGSLAHGIRDKISTAYASATKMMKLVNELLEFNRLDSGQVKLNLAYGDFSAFIKEVTKQFELMADQRRIDFKVNVVENEIWGWFDGDKLEKVIVNILSNAFKFTPEGGSISLEAKEIEYKEKTTGKRKLVELSVTDSGIGISQAELPFVFNKFYQAKSADSIQNPGTGIGLALAKALIEQHCGTITAQSTPKVKTTFTIQFPIDEEHYEAKGLLPAEYPLADPIQENAEDYPDEEPEKSKNKLVIIEDNDELRKYLVAEFEDDYEVFAAKDGEEGLGLAIEMVPDLVLSDILMPKVSGLDLCNQLKTNIRTSHVPVILLTAKATVDDQVTGIENGADLYITKPFSIRVLKASVAKLIQYRAELFAKYSQEVYLASSKNSGNKMEEKFLKEVVDFIEENIQDSQLGVDAIAAQLNLSRTQVYRKIKALTGKSTVEFIRTVRLKRAIRHMDEKRYNLAEISFLCGFSSPSYFTRSFKETFGKAPSEYIKG